MHIFSNLTAGAGVALLSLVGAPAAHAQSLNMYGTTGLIDMPSAESQPDAELTMTASHFAGITKSTLSFQILPRISGSFRYAGLKDYDPITPASPDGTRFDRSFDIQFRLMDESTYLPAVAVGLRDFMGTGLYGSEYIVATKNLTPTLKATAGLGWGRLGDTDTVRAASFGLGGKPNVGDWFTGPIGAFGGIEWITPVKGLTFKAEYSSDRYALETVTRTLFERKSPMNFGLEYTPREHLTLGLYHMYGSEVGFRLSAALNPRRPIATGSFESAPLPIKPRATPIDRDTAWLATPGINARGRSHLTTVLKNQGIQVEALAMDANLAELRIRNTKYNATPQAIGRAARAMAFVMPDSVDTFVITPVEKGIPVTSVVLNRTDLERYESDPNGTEAMLAAAGFENPKPLPANAEYQEGLYPKFNWAISPYLQLSLFDPTKPLRAELGLRAAADWTISPGLSLAGSVTKSLVGNLGEGQPEPSCGPSAPPTCVEPPHVRSEIAKYQTQGDPAIEYLTGEYLFKLSPSVYGRVTAGYLESMFGGVQGEVLWKPVGQSWGLGADIAYAKQRDFDQLLGFQDYDIVTGHVSAYWSLPNGFHTEINAGRYLAGDWGATVSVDRTFANGWSVGAYATLTDMPFESFGEGSFDKGIRMNIPLAWALGTPTRKSSSINLTSLTRDGGARLASNTRLYSLVRDYHRPNLDNRWARFWR